MKSKLNRRRAGELKSQRTKLLKHSGSPLDSDWPGYHTHFIPMSVFNRLLDSDGNRKDLL